MRFGGKWDSQNKKAPGTYINFTSQSSDAPQISVKPKNYPLMKSRGTWWVADEHSFGRELIIAIHIIDKYTPTGKETESWVIDEAELGDITAYFINGCEIIIAGNGSGKIKLCENAQAMFDSFTNLKEIVGLELLDVSDVTAIDDFFLGCSKLKSVDLSSWNCVRVTTIQRMFKGCSSIETIKMPRCGWTNITNIAMTKEVFKGCIAVKEIDLGKGLRYIGDQCFLGCVSLKEIRGTEDVIEVGSECFLTCFELEYVDFMKKLAKVDDFGFATTAKLQHSGIRAEKITSLGASAFRASSVEDSVCLDNLPPETVGSLATRMARWGSMKNIDAVQEGAKSFPNVEMEIENPDSQGNYEDISFAKSNIKDAGCGPLSLFHCWQILHPEATNEEIQFRTWYEDKLGEERMSKYSYANGSYGGEMIYTIVNDIANSDNKSLGLTMSEKFTPLEVDRIRLALEAGNPLVCIIRTFKAGSSGNHMITIHGYNKSTGKLKVTDSGFPEKAYQYDVSLEDLMYYVDKGFFSKVYVVSRVD